MGRALRDTVDRRAPADHDAKRAETRAVASQQAGAFSVQRPLIGQNGLPAEK